MNTLKFKLAILIVLTLFHVELLAWNVLYSSQSNPGKARSQIICRNSDNSGSVTVSAWIFNSVVPSVCNLKFIEVDDAGDLVKENVISVKFSNSLDVKRLEIHRILLNRDSISYIVLGTAHNPVAGSPKTRSFLMKVDLNLNCVQMKYLDQYFN